MKVARGNDDQLSSVCQLTTAGFSNRRLFANRCQSDDCRRFDDSPSFTPCRSGLSRSITVDLAVTPATAPVPALRHDSRHRRRGGAMRAYLKAVAVTLGLLGAWLALLPLVA